MPTNNMHELANLSNCENFYETEPTKPRPAYNPDAVFGLQFAASQWSKLVTHAEDLFNNLVSSNQVSDKDRKQICEWLFLKQECEECISSEETISLDATIEEPVRSLGRIDEETETDSQSAESLSSLSETESETETDIDYSQVNISDIVGNYLSKFQNQTDQLVLDNYKTSTNRPPVTPVKNPDHETDYFKTHGRRRSVQPDQTGDFDKFKNHPETSKERGPSRNDAKTERTITKADKKLKQLTSNMELKQNKLRKLSTDIYGTQRQLDELVQTIDIKEQLVNDMMKNGEIRTCVKQKFQRKHARLEEEYYKTKAQLAHAQKQLVHNKTSRAHDVDKYKTLAHEYEKRLKDIESIKQIADDSAKRVIEMENSLHTSRKQVERLRKKLKKDEKSKAGLRKEIEEDARKANELERLNQVKKRAVDDGVSRASSTASDVRNENVSEKDARVHEIRTLRKTRDVLVAEKCELKRKVHNKMISDEDERKLLETDEAIEAIDAVIEYKNELLCGRKRFDRASDAFCNAMVVKRDCVSLSISANFDLEQMYHIQNQNKLDKCQELLMQRLMKLSENEMRTILYKYFQKVVDLRDSGKKLEKQMTDLERDYETSTYRVQALCHALRQLRLEGEKRLVLLQRQHEDKLNLMLRHFTDETSAASSSSVDQLITYSNSKVEHKSIRCGNARESDTDNTTTDVSTFDLAHKRIDHAITTHASFKHQNTSRKSSEERFITSKYCRQEHKNATTTNHANRVTHNHEKNRLIARFHELTRYHHERAQVSHRVQQTSVSTLNLSECVAPVTSAAPNPAAIEPATKVTRQKNKLIIQQQGKVARK